MITIESIANATYRKSAINRVSRLNPELQEQMKRSETPAVPTIPDNDAEAASIDPNSLRGKLADIHYALHRNNVYSSALQNFRQSLARLMEKREQIREQIKELARLGKKEKDKKVEQEAMWEKIDTLKKQINDIVNNTHFDGNKIFTAAGQDMAFFVGDDVVINIPAKDFGVSPTDVDLSEDTNTLSQKIKKEIQAIMDYDGFLLGVEKKIESFTTMMAFELQDILKVEEHVAEKNMTLELAKFSLARVQENLRKALHGQANVSPDAAAALLIDANKDAGQP